MTRVALVIPALNAEATVGDVVRAARAVVADVLVVDDGSTDATGEVARAAGARVHSHPSNRGKGAALRTAFEILFRDGADAVVTMDADGQHAAGELARLLETDGDIVLGSRRHSFDGMSRLRRTSNRASSWAISCFAGLPLADAQTGFRKYGRRCLERTGFPGDRFDAESAVLVRAARLGFSVVEVPVAVVEPDGRATSHYRVWVDSLRIARAVVSARIELLGGRG